MPIDIIMPALSPTMEAGTLAKWLVDVGDAVEPGDIIAEVETDKATMEVEATEQGVVSRLLVPSGMDDVHVGAVIATLVGEDEAALPAPSPAGQSIGPAATTGREWASREHLSPAVRRLVVSNNLDAAAIIGTGKNGRLTKADVLDTLSATVGKSADTQDETAAGGGSMDASSLARRIAAAKNIDLNTVEGSGPEGRIILADLLARPATAFLAPVPAAASAAIRASEGDGGVPAVAEKLSNMRRTIARRLTESKQNAPHFYLRIDVRLDALLRQRAELNAAIEGKAKLSVNDLLIKALARALIEVPDANVRFAGDELLRFSRADISVAVAVPGGLVTPVLRSADTRSLSDLSNRMKSLVEKARAGKLQSADQQGGTASLSNLGMYGVREMLPVINPPQGLILGIGAGEPRAVVDSGGQLVAATIVSITASFDHRAIDGAVGAEFLSAFRGFVERPLALLG